MRQRWINSQIEELILYIEKLEITLKAQRSALEDVLCKVHEYETICQWIFLEIRKPRLLTTREFKGCFYKISEKSLQTQRAQLEKYKRAAVGPQVSVTNTESHLHFKKGELIKLEAR